MSNIQDTVRYILVNYPYSDDMSKTRLTKLVYLSDWYNSKTHNSQITPVKWYFDHYGPYVTDVVSVAENDEYIEIINTQSAYGSPKKLISLKPSFDDNIHINLSQLEKESIDKVIEDTKDLNFSRFIDFVYSTYPIKQSTKYNFLNLPSLALEEIDYFQKDK